MVVTMLSMNISIYNYNGINEGCRFHIPCTCTIKMFYFGVKCKNIPYLQTLLQDKKKFDSQAFMCLTIATQLERSYLCNYTCSSRYVIPRTPSHIIPRSVEAESWNIRKGPVPQSLCQPIWMSVLAHSSMMALLIFFTYCVP